MSRRMYPKRMCNTCKHVIDIGKDICGRDLIMCECDECEYEEWSENMSDGEVLEKYREIQRLGFVKGLYRASYDNLCLAEKAKIPLREYVGEADEAKYCMLLNECLLKVEELSDMLWMLEEKMMKSWMYEGKEEEERE